MKEMLLPGKQLEVLCSQAYSEVILVAPFIKAAALARLLLAIPEVATLRCVTRWRPEEIVAGVSDLEVWSLLEKLPRASLWLRPDLHAKYYRADHSCLVGSANITATALGWMRQPNLELLVPLAASSSELAGFERNLFDGSVQVEQSMFEQMQQTVHLFKEQYIRSPFSDISTEFTPENIPQQLVINNTWLPTLRNPEDLYLAYCGRLEKLSSASQQAALLDLRSLSIPPKLSKPVFQSYVGSLLLQMSMIDKIDSFVETPKRFGAITSLLSSSPCSQSKDFDANRTWQTLMRWLCYFLPNRYTLSVPNHSEIFSKIKSDL